MRYSVVFAVLSELSIEVIKAMDVASKISDTALSSIAIETEVISSASFSTPADDWCSLGCRS